MLWLFFARPTKKNKHKNFKSTTTPNLCIFSIYFQIKFLKFLKIKRFKGAKILHKFRPINRSVGHFIFASLPFREFVKIIVIALLTIATQKL